MTKIHVRHSNPRSRLATALPAQASASAGRNPALKNHLLASLPTAEFRRLESKLEFVSVKFNQVFYESSQRIEYVYFPTTAIVSLVCVMENGSTVATSLIGNEGMVGVALLMGAENFPNEAIVQCAGESLRLNYLDLRKEFRRCGVLQMLLMRYSAALLAQTAQTAACNRLHSVEMQLCRWLLITHDRLDSNNFSMTHETISKMLGVSREGITLALKKLKKRKLIENVRGSITIINRQELEKTVCECYRRITGEYNSLLGRGISRTFG